MSELRIDPRGVRLLVVDTDLRRREALASALDRGGYGAVVNVGSVADFSATHQTFDLILVDADAPGFSPTDLDTIRATVGEPAPPIVGVTDDLSAEGRDRIARLGVRDVVTRPVAPAHLRLILENALSTHRLRRLLGERSSQLTVALRERSAETDMVRESLSVLAAMAEYHDDDTDQHPARVGTVSAAIAAHLGLPDSFAEMIRAAAPLHDIGKVGVSRRILLKPGKLTEHEWVHMQQHVEIGAQILASAQSPVLVLAAEIARTHHERYDGSGYISGLVGEDIPISGRIVAVADVFDTLIHDRPYRPAWEAARARAEIDAGAGTLFDPQVVAAFAAIQDDARAVAA